ncbi:hypothetical protein GCM10011495_13500 [Hymenobacter frigidus]|uniref:Uncharacterized protein n=1 Tax=Hymenobacter frigidus TaxID=1524095 RepID=A0ABQ2A0X3_9BACT|nr:hypothetical protein GCM10011495_13500 [Hymenobacter frigidus]
MRNVVTNAGTLAGQITNTGHDIGGLKNYKAGKRAANIGKSLAFTKHPALFLVRLPLRGWFGPKFPGTVAATALAAAAPPPVVLLGEDEVAFGRVVKITGLKGLGNGSGHGDYKATVSGGWNHSR